jgi:hypothetical protein
MRVTPRIGRKVWFAPRRDGLGFGWRPFSWEGWLVSAIALAVIGLSVAFLDGRAATVSVPSAVGALLLAALLKGTSPGGREESMEYDRRTRGGRNHVKANALEDPSLADAAEALRRAQRGES